MLLDNIEFAAPTKWTVRDLMDQLLNKLRATAEPTRLRILVLCARTELTVSELTRILGQSQPRVSRHLKLLVEAGLLERFQEGSWMFHRAARDSLGARVLLSLGDLMPAEDPVIAGDGARLAEVKQERADAASAYFGTNAASWDQLRALHVDEAEVENAVLSFLPEDGIDDFLDVGTGTGRMLELVAPQIGAGVGIDMSRDMLAVARTNLDRADIGHCQVRQSDMYQMALPSRSFDAAIIHQVLHFADDPARAIAETARVLKPGGMLLAVDFAPHGQESLRDEHEHRRLGFADAEVGGWFADAELEVRRIAHLPGTPLTVTLWVGIKPELDSVDGAGDHWVWMSEIQDAVH